MQGAPSFHGSCIVFICSGCFGGNTQTRSERASATIWRALLGKSEICMGEKPGEKNEEGEEENTHTHTHTRRRRRICTLAVHYRIWHLGTCLFGLCGSHDWIVQRESTRAFHDADTRKI